MTLRANTICPTVLLALLAGLCLALASCGGAGGGDDDDDGGGGGGGGDGRPGVPRPVALLHARGLTGAASDGEDAVARTAQGIARFVREGARYTQTSALWLPTSGGRGVSLGSGAAFVPAGADGLRVFLTTDPASTTSLSRYHPGGSNIVACVVAGSVAYLADRGYGLRAIDVRDPRYLAVVAARALAGASTVAVSESPSRAWLGTVSGTVAGYDRGSSGCPELGRSELGAAIDALAAEGTVLYALVRGRGLVLCNSAVPSRLQALGEVPLESAADMRLAGGTMLVLRIPESGEPLLTSIDVTDPLRPAVVSEEVVADAVALGDLAGGALVVGEDGFSERDPSAPSASPIAPGFTSHGAVRRVSSLSGTCLAGADRALLLADARDPRAATVAAALEVDQPPLAVSVGEGVACALLPGAPPRVLALDVTSLSAAAVVAEVALEGALDLSVAERIAWVALGTGGVARLDLADPAAPVATTLEPPQGALAVLGRGSLLYVVDTAGALRCYEWIDGGLEGTCDPRGLPGPGQRLWCDGARLVVSCAGSGLEVFTLGDARAPSPLGSASPSGGVLASLFRSGAAYIANGGRASPLMWFGGTDGPVTYTSLDLRAGVLDLAYDRGAIHYATADGLVLAEP